MSPEVGTSSLVIRLPDERVFGARQRQLNVEMKLDLTGAVQRERGSKSAVLSRRRNFAWATAGKDKHVGDASENGFASLIATEHHMLLVTANNKAQHFRDKVMYELLVEQFVYPWYNSADQDSFLHKIPDPVIGEAELEPAMSMLGSTFTPIETARYRWLGARASEATTPTVDAVRAGDTEELIAGRMALEMSAAGIRLPVLLVGTDHRILRHRYPIPTKKRRDRSLMVAAAARWRLDVALTRMVADCEEPSDDVVAQYALVARIKAKIECASAPDVRLSDLFCLAAQRYADAGIPNSSQDHHQGGVIGYWGREAIAAPDSHRMVRCPSALACNSSLSGVEAEDTVLVNEDGGAVITIDAHWPTGFGGASEIRTLGGDR